MSALSVLRTGRAVPTTENVRARGTGSVMALVISAGLGLVTLRSCSGGDAASPAAPGTLAGNGLAAVCAERRAVDDAGSSADALAPVTLPSELAARLDRADPALAGVVRQAAACPPVTP